MMDKQELAMKINALADELDALKADNEKLKGDSDMPEIYIPDVIWMSSATGGNFLVVDITPDKFKEEPEVYGRALPYASIEAAEREIKKLPYFYIQRRVGEREEALLKRDVLALLREMAGEE